MVSFRQILSILCLVSSTYLIGCSHRSSHSLAGAQILNDSEIAGEKVFMQNCQRCHPQGAAGLGPSILWAPGFAKRFQVRHGAGAMPAFDKEHLSEKELDQLMEYLKALKNN
ncbi:cytochrome c [Algoriphagus sp. AGSA1]|uniref:c-type cytochrome n=1 Tax=Algoriphagus sp. AGSA1 TaxID=2907213 RepID=UPI0030EC2E83|nr:cytochrome c [Algoriphagus sp. AGSA1]